MRIWIRFLESYVTLFFRAYKDCQAWPNRLGNTISAFLQEGKVSTILNEAVSEISIHLF